MKKVDMAALVLSLSVLGSATGRADDAKPKKDPVKVGDKKALAELLKKKITVKLEKASFVQAVDAVRAATDANIIVDPALVSQSVSLPGASLGVEHEISIKVEGEPASKVLDMIAAQHGDCSIEPCRGILYLTRKSSPKHAPPAPKLTAGAQRAAAERRVSLNFQGQGVGDVAQFLSEITDVKFSVAEDVDPECKLTLKLRDASLADALDVICWLTGLKLEAKGDENVFSPR